jgi:hypothetical protein
VRRLAAVAPLLVLAACTSAVTGSPAPAPAVPTSTTQAPVAGVTVGGGCDLLEPVQVEEITGRSGVSEVGSGVNDTSDFQGCFYDDDDDTRQIFLTVSYARGHEGTDGQRRADDTAAALAPSEPVGGIGAGAAFSPGTDGQAFVFVAFADEERGGLLTVTFRGELPRDQLEALARQVDENL